MSERDLGEARKKKGGPSSGEVAERILEVNHLVTDDQEVTYRWTGAHWTPARKARLNHMAYAAGAGGSNDQRAQVIGLLRARTYEPELVWGRVGEGEVPALNGVVDAVAGTIRAHCPEDYLERTIPWRWRPGAECPRFHEALTEWFGDDDGGAELIAALQEFMGYCCLQHARYKKALLLYGEREDTGKSQLAFVFEALVGTRWTCQLPPAQMDDPRMRAVIKGKALNSMTELSADAMVRDGGFKTLVSTEEPILIDEKYELTEMYTPSAKHVIATNKLPRIDDRTQATYRRLLLLPMERQVPVAAQDPNLKDKLAAEMEGIFAWAVEGAGRLVARGGVWPEPERSRAAMADYRAEQNPVHAFLHERAVEDAHGRVPVAEVARAFNEWNQGGRRADLRSVSRMLRQDGQRVEKARWGQQTIATLYGWRLLSHDERLALGD